MHWIDYLLVVRVWVFRKSGAKYNASKKRCWSLDFLFSENSVGEIHKQETGGVAIKKKLRWLDSTLALLLTGRGTSRERSSVPSVIFAKLEKAEFFRALTRMQILSRCRSGHKTQCISAINLISRTEMSWDMHDMSLEAEFYDEGRQLC